MHERRPEHPASVFGNEMVPEKRVNLGTYRYSFSKLAWGKQGTVHTYACFSRGIAVGRTTCLSAIVNVEGLAGDESAVWM